MASEFVKHTMGLMRKGATGGELQSPHSTRESKKAKSEALKRKTNPMDAHVRKVRDSLAKTKHTSYK